MLRETIQTLSLNGFSLTICYLQLQRASSFEHVLSGGGVGGGAGAEIKTVMGPQEGRNPVVLARIGRDPSKPTILFYGGPLCQLAPPS